MLEPLVKTIEVPCSQREAFTVFVDEMHTWWPLAKFTVSAFFGAAARTLRVEAKVGGQIVEIGHDGKEHLWGTIEAYDPYDYLRTDFHIPHPDETVISRSQVEVRFTKLADKLTRVELTQSDWEAFGERAAALQGGYGQGWVVIFEKAYRRACGG